MHYLSFLFGLLIQPNTVTAEPGTIFQDCSVCPEMVVVPAGSFLMGDGGDWYSRRHERPQHHVTIERPFAVGRYEVTFAEWDACLENGGCKNYKPDDFGFGRGKRPVFNVSWNAVQAYIRWLNNKSGHSYRLLTEAEWEYMARAGTTTDFTTGHTITPKQANYNGNPHNVSSEKDLNRNKTMPVGSFPPNLFGIFDVEGNVREYTQDCWHENYKGAPKDGSAWLKDGDCKKRVTRSGAWGAVQDDMRTASRGSLAVHRTSVSYSFRLARDITLPQESTTAR